MAATELKSPAIVLALAIVTLWIVAVAGGSTNLAPANKGSVSITQDPFRPHSLPSVDEGVINWSKTESGNCLVVKDGFGFTACPRGVPQGIHDVAFIGDSHMRQYFADLDFLAFKYHWKVTYISKSACTVGDYRQLPSWFSVSCRDWNKRLDRYLSTREPFDLIINSNSAFVSQDSKQIAGAFRATVASQVARGSHWFVIWDNPKPRPDFLNCIASFGARAPKKCAVTYSQSMIPYDDLPTAISNLPNTNSLDLKSVFCPNGTCPPVIDNTVVYRDYSHISSTFSKTLVGLIDAAVPEEFKEYPSFPVEVFARHLAGR